MKKVYILTLAFVIGSATLMANNENYYKIPPTKQDVFEGDGSLILNSSDEISLLTNVPESSNLANETLKSKHLLIEQQRQQKLEAIKNYADLMPDIIRKE